MNSNNSQNLAPFDDINLKIFDEICEERFSKIDLDALLVVIIDKLPADALPHLAEQYHITGNEGWLQCKNDDEKRALIKSAIKIHRYKGTKYALQEVFKSLNIPCEIKEWFQYNGRPYHFMLEFDVFDMYDDQFEKNLLNLVDENKNVRSKLERMSVNLTKNADIKFVSYVITNEGATL